LPLLSVTLDPSNPSSTDRSGSTALHITGYESFPSYSFLLKGFRIPSRIAFGS